MAVERAKVAGRRERAPVKEEKEERRTLKPRSSKLERWLVGDSGARRGLPTSQCEQIVELASDRKIMFSFLSPLY